jgi:hypothetical protein
MEDGQMRRTTDDVKAAIERLLRRHRSRSRIDYMIVVATTPEGAVGVTAGAPDFPAALNGLDRALRSLDYLNRRDRPEYPEAAPEVVYGAIGTAPPSVADLLTELTERNRRGEILELVTVVSGSWGPYFDFAGWCLPDTLLFARRLRRELEAHDGFRAGETLQVRWPVPPPRASLQKLFED